jgi:hypothetical protein
MDGRYERALAGRLKCRVSNLPYGFSLWRGEGYQHAFDLGFMSLRKRYGRRYVGLSIRICSMKPRCRLFSHRRLMAGDAKRQLLTFWERFSISPRLFAGKNIYKC